MADNIFGFLFSFLVASDTKVKLNKKKANAQLLQELRELAERSEMIDKNIREKFVDMELETNIKPISNKEMLDLSKTLPSYDKAQKWNVSTKDELYFDIEKFKHRFALAKAGKLPRGEAHVGIPIRMYSNVGKFWGREMYDYRGQIKHELMLLWEKKLNEAGFPCKLYVKNDFEDASYRKLASQTKYMCGNSYFWEC